jgi:hypothetical protein
MGLYTLRFPDYATARAAAQQLGFWDEDANTLKTVGQVVREDGILEYGWAIIEVGQDPVIENGEYDAEGNEIMPPVRLPGYVVNVSGNLPPAAAAFLAPGGYGCAGGLFAGTRPGPQPPERKGTAPDEIVEHDGATWIWQQARWGDGTFRADDPATLADEAFEWVRQ